MSAESMVCVFAELHAGAGKEDALKDAVRAIVGPTRKEAGCLQYNWHVDNSDPGHILFYENWASQAHLDAHLASPHMKTFLGRGAELLRGPAGITVATRSN